ncbi:hypothetical protein RUMHYD_01719 [Blautia hydrogenotrophica DSM 10507]|uniref:Uncharacterized protein n=1 Tax=Blautia hydrogenotrophica (strain DSM 10507 / JCM 14656 / S5a33) TaxID=476272 RepID=C0CLJ7_BLAHS|nr:hypothetical protein RUMHYD_01719 [Blautia hydrogenotrophica DSM 10507]
MRNSPFSGVAAVRKVGRSPQRLRGGKWKRTCPLCPVFPIQWCRYFD